MQWRWIKTSCVELWFGNMGQDYKLRDGSQ